MTAMLRVPRSRGALSGVLLILLGLWGGLVPFVGPYFHYAYTPDRAWDFTAGRVWLEPADDDEPADAADDAARQPASSTPA
ncbi:MAG: hypothetical protein ACLP70_13885 [Streptosporangiaceae bacterium]